MTERDPRRSGCWWSSPRALCSADLKRIRGLAGAVCGVFAAGATVAQVAGAALWLRLTFASIAVVGGTIMAVLLRLVQLAERDEEKSAKELTLAARLRTGGIKRFAELSPYELGVDREALRPEVAGGEQTEYLPRNCDDDLRKALDAAACHGNKRMIVVDGPSKVGKSRTLFHNVRESPLLASAWTIAPTPTDGGEALAALFEPGGLPNIEGAGPLILWLDDLEYFIALARGMNARFLKMLLQREPYVVVMATVGGKGATQVTDPRLADPLDQLKCHPAVEIVVLDRCLTEDEKSLARARYTPEAAADIVEHGIAEYMVAAQELATKFVQQRHKDGSSCSEGAAVVWAAIDWARAGMLKPIPEHQLRELWRRYYLQGLPTNDERFQRGLEWALMPLHATIALLKGANGAYTPYDYIVSYADDRFNRDIDSSAWDCILEFATPTESYGLARKALHRESPDRLSRSERALVHAEASSEPEMSGTAAVVLGVLLVTERSDEEGALAAFRRADERGDAGGASNLGAMLNRRGDEDGALAAFRRADERGDAEGTSSLGVMLEKQGDKDGALAAFRRADERGNAAGAFNLGLTLERRDDDEGALAAYSRADDRGDAAGAVNLGLTLEKRGDREGALAAFRRADDRGNAAGAFDLGVMQLERGDKEGALAAFRRADYRGNADGAVKLGVMLYGRGDKYGALAAFQRADERGNDAGAANLGMMLERRGDKDGALAAYRRADERGNASGAFNLGEMLDRRGDEDGALAAFQRADERGDARGAFKLGVMLERRGDDEGALAAYSRADECGDAAGAANLGLILEKRGDHEGALAAYRRADKRRGLQPRCDAEAEEARR